MAQIQFYLMKFIKIGRLLHLLTPQLLKSDNISFLPYCLPPLKVDAICVSPLVSISKFMQSRKDEINSKYIVERFLFSLSESLIMSQIVESVCSKVVLYLKGSGWFSPIIVGHLLMYVFEHRLSFRML